MKKVLALLLAVLMVVVLAACGNNTSIPTEVINEEDQVSNSTELAVEEPNTEVTMSSTTNEVMEYFLSIVNLNDYEESYSSDTISLTLKSDLNKQFNCPTTILLGNKEISLPCDYSELVDADWHFAYDFGEQTIDEAGTSSISHLDAVITNGEGKELWVTMTNESAKPISIKDSICTGFSIPTATKNRVKNDKAPDFEISTIRYETTLKKVIGIWGNPNELMYDEQSDEITAIYNDEKTKRSIYIKYFWGGSDDKNIMRELYFFLSN